MGGVEIMRMDMRGSDLPDWMHFFDDGARLRHEAAVHAARARLRPGQCVVSLGCTLRGLGGRLLRAGEAVTVADLAPRVDAEGRLLHTAAEVLRHHIRQGVVLEGL
jgi:hypothetical protein